MKLIKGGFLLSYLLLASATIFNSPQSIAKLPSQTAKNHHISLAEIKPTDSLVLNTQQEYFREVIDVVAHRLNWTTTINSYPGARALHLMSSKQVIGAFPVRRSNYQDDKLLYSIPIPSGEVGLLKKVNAPSLSNRYVRIGLIRGESIPDSLNVEKDFEFTFANNYNSLMGLLAKGRIDAVFIDRFSAIDMIVQEHPELVGKVIFDPNFSFNSPHHFAISTYYPSAESLIKEFNSALNELKNDGTLTKILESYGIFTPRPATPNKQQIVIAAPDINAISAGQQYSRLFEQANPNIEVIWRVFEENVLRDRLLGNFALNKQEFDIVLIGPFELSNWLEQGWFLPININLMRTAFDDLFDNHKKTIKIKNTLYAMPFTGETTVLFYRKDLMKKNGLTLPDKLTYQSMLPLLEKLHQPDKGQFGIGLRTRPGWGQNMALISILVNTLGGSWTNSEGKINVVTQEWLEAVDLYKLLLQKYGPNELEDLGWQDNQKLFAEGKIAFLIDASNLSSYFLNPNVSVISDKFAIADVPIVKQYDGARWFWSWNFAIPNSSTNPKLAESFIQFMAKQKSGVEHAYLTPPGVRHSDYKNNGALQGFTQSMIEYRLINGYQVPEFDSTIGRQYADTIYFPTIGFHVGFQIHKSLLNEISTKQALLNAQQKIDEIIAPSRSSQP